MILALGCQTPAACFPSRQRAEVTDRVSHQQTLGVAAEKTVDGIEHPQLITEHLEGRLLEPQRTFSHQKAPFHLPEPARVSFIQYSDKHFECPLMSDLELHTDSDSSSMKQPGATTCKDR